jgi:para-nitrobenzyl esterase
MSGQQLVGRTPEHATETARKVIATLGVTPERLEEIKTVPMEKLLAAMRGGEWTPVVDGHALPRDPFSPDAPPLSADIPMILGNTHDETAYFYGRPDPSTFTLTWETLPGKLRDLAKAYLGDLSAETVIAKYRELYPNYTPSQVFFASTTAARSWRGMVTECERRAEQGGPTWAYNLTWRSPVDGGKWGAPHTRDIPLFFGNPGFTPKLSGDGPDAQAMANLMSDTLLAFARTSNPNHAAIPNWPRFDLKTRSTMLFELPSRVEADPRGAKRNFFASVPYDQPGR